MVKLPLLLLALISIPLVVSPASATDYGDVVVTVAPQPSGSRAHGYVEYRVSVTNRASQTAHQVRLTIPGSGYGMSPLEEVSRSVTVQASSTITVSLLVPGLPVYGSGLGVSIDGRRESEQVVVDLVEIGDLSPSVLLSQNVSRIGFNPPELRRGPFSSPNSGLGSPTTLPIAEWSESWLGYSSYDCIVATADEFRSLPANVSSAVLQFVKCGGTLLVLGSVNVPEDWKVRVKGPAQIPTYYVGYGECLVAAKELARFSEDDWNYLHDSCVESQSPFIGAEAHEPADANRVFPVVEKLVVPVRGLFLLMLVFVIVIGPLNLFILSRRKRKIWLLWTVPAISLITCVAVSAYSILSEGWSGKARTAALTILDESSHQATTIGWSAFYSPLTPGEGLHYGYETELTPQIGPQYSYNRSQTGHRSVDWTEDQHLASGWVSARVPAHFRIRKSEVRRERITLNRGPGDSLSVVNGLGVDVRELWLADRDRRIYSVKNLKAGSSAVLALQPNAQAHGIVEELRLAFAGSDWFNLPKWTHSPERLLMPGCYIAATDSSPFIEDGLKDVGSRKNESVIYGIMKAE